MSDAPALPFLDGNAMAYTITVIKNCRRRFFPFLWRDLDRQDLMASARSLAWLILVEDRPATRKALWNATQRRLYAEAKSWGWRRTRGCAMRYDQRLVMVGTIERHGEERPRPGAMRREVVTALVKILDVDELAVLGGLIADLTEKEIAAALATTLAAVQLKRRIIRRKLRQELERNAL